MAVATLTIDVYEALADCLTYPEPRALAGIERAPGTLRDRYPAAAAHLDRFMTATETWSPEKLQEAFTRAFDISPQCVPYLSVFLFGEESFKRAELMTGLKAAYENAGFDCGPELPDHLAVVLRFAAAFEPEEWAELMCWCVPGPLKAMIAGLEKAGNPYVHVLMAVRAVLKTQYPREFESC